MSEELHLVWRCLRHNRIFKFGQKCPYGKDKCSRKWALHHEVTEVQHDRIIQETNQEKEVSK